jgi:hypothetical protein
MPSLYYLAVKPNMLMKQIFRSATLAIVLATGLVACGGNDNRNEVVTDSTTITHTDTMQAAPATMENAHRDTTAHDTSGKGGQELPSDQPTRPKRTGTQ